MLGSEATVGRLRAELQDLSDTIQRTMHEVARIRHPMMENDRVQSAVDELGTIVAATELATEQILTATETIERSVTSSRDAGLDRRAVTDAVTAIYAACSFQDVTGQRLTRVMNLLRTVDERLLAIVEHLGPDRFGTVAPPEAAATGPTTPGLQQASIDTLFS